MTIDRFRRLCYTAKENSHRVGLAANPSVSSPRYAERAARKRKRGKEAMPKKILAVDDERHIVRLVQVNLERAGYEVVTAFDGKDALEKVASEQRSEEHTSELQS